MNITFKQFVEALNSYIKDEGDTRVIALGSSSDHEFVIRVSTEDGKERTIRVSQYLS